MVLAGYVDCRRSDPLSKHKATDKAKSGSAAGTLVSGHTGMSAVYARVLEGHAVSRDADTTSGHALPGR